MRAYTDATKACIAATEVVIKRMVIPLVISTNYNDLGKLQYILGNEGIEIKESEYGENVILTVEVCVEDIDRIEKLLTEATAARVILERKTAIFSICRGG